MSVSLFICNPVFRPYTNFGTGSFEYEFFPVQKYFYACYLPVEGFFMISGFLLASQLAGKDIENIDIAKLIFKKIKKLYPMYIMAFALALSVSILTSRYLISDLRLSQAVIEAALLQMTGFTNSTYYNYPAWFVSSLFIGMGCVLLIYKFFNKIFTPFLIISPFLIYNLFYSSGAFGTFETRHLVMLDGNLRAIAGLSVGMLVYKSLPFIANLNKYAIMVLELAFMAWLLPILFRSSYSLDNFQFLMVFPILLLLTLSGSGVVSRILNTRLMQWLGSMSMYLFLTHISVVFAFVKIYNTYFTEPALQHYFIKTGVFVLLAILLAATAKYIDGCMRKKINTQPL